jgi:uncharacterized protein DUF6804
MLTKILKLIAIAVLIVGLFWRPLVDYRTFLQFVVSAAAAAVLVQAAHMRQYLWMIFFGLAACLFNPVLPIGFSDQTSIVLSSLTLLLFFFSLQLLKPKPRLSIASITDRMPGSESL